MFVSFNTFSQRFVSKSNAVFVVFFPRRGRRDKCRSGMMRLGGGGAGVCRSTIRGQKGWGPRRWRLIQTVASHLSRAFGACRTREFHWQLTAVFAAVVVRAHTLGDNSNVYNDSPYKKNHCYAIF